MKCSCCNRTLSDYEACLRHSVTKDFTDTCLRCLAGLNIPVVGREDLKNKPSWEQLSLFGEDDE